MFSSKSLQLWVEEGHVEKWFKWVEWVALTSALFVAVTYCTYSWSAGLVLALATASMVQCYMVSVVWLIKPLLSGADKLCRANFNRPLLFGLVFIGSSVVLGCAMAAITSLILSALAQNAV